MATATATPSRNDKSLSYAEMQARLATLEAENAKLKASPKGKLSMKVSEKTGALSVYGLMRFPVTLYASQWPVLAEKLFGIDPSAFDATPIGAFIRDNHDKLTWKE